ncbi:DUF6233 domain-containing protein [Streptomyces sp. NPDC088341]|uniref:DUF6233 domain-containing protein n=1 Tax=Streptomyces sp. NPDC088341 TaxID=3154870 RepID=UPI003434C137
MSDIVSPHVTVMFPGGRVAEGRLHGRRRDADGWWYDVSVELPADAVRPIAGEDYDGVPTARGGSPTGPGWVLQALPHTRVLHQTGCWVASGGLTPTTATEAASLVTHKRAVPCDVCNPAP